MNSHDPIVEDVWRLRAEAWAACDDDPERYFAHLAAVAAEHPERLVGPDEFVRRFGRPSIGAHSRRRPKASRGRRRERSGGTNIDVSPRCERL